MSSSLSLSSTALRIEPSRNWIALERVFSRKDPDFCLGSKSSSFFALSLFFCSSRSLAQKGRPPDEESGSGGELGPCLGLLRSTFNDGEAVGGGGGQGIPEGRERRT